MEGVGRNRKIFNKSIGLVILGLALTFYRLEALLDQSSIYSISGALAWV